jgi:hypothetical protein
MARLQHRHIQHFRGHAGAPSASISSRALESWLVDRLLPVPALCWPVCRDPSPGKTRPCCKSPPPLAACALGFTTRTCPQTVKDLRAYRIGQDCLGNQVWRIKVDRSICYEHPGTVPSPYTHLHDGRHNNMASFRGKPERLLGSACLLSDGYPCS